MFGLSVQLWERQLTRVKALLDTSHIRRRYHPIYLDHARILCSSHIGQEGGEDEKRDGQREYCGTIGTRKQINELCDYDGYDPSIPHALSRIDRALHLHVSQSGVRDLLPLFRSVSNYFPRAQFDLSFQCWRDWIGRFSHIISRTGK